MAQSTVLACDKLGVWNKFLTVFENFNFENENTDLFFNQVQKNQTELSTIDNLIDIGIQYSQTMLHKGFIHENIAKHLLNIQVSRSCEPTFSSAMNNIKDLLSEKFIQFVNNHDVELDLAINHDRNQNLSLSGLKLILKQYVLRRKNGQEILETPQYMFMRIAIQATNFDLSNTITTYDMLSSGDYTHASPTMFNAGTTISSFASCFLLSIEKNSIGGIYEKLSEAAQACKIGGGLGINYTNIQGTVYPSGDSGNSIMPSLRVFNETAKYVNQKGKRPGAMAIYLEPWHLNIFEFCNMRKNTGDENLRCRDLFTGLWIPDLFMERVRADEDWSLFDSNKYAYLSDLYGSKFEQEYTKLESLGLQTTTVSAQSVWCAIISSQMETGTPYILFKDTINRVSNHKYLGTIKQSNLCAEIVQYSDEANTAVCQLASINISNHVIDKKIDWYKLEKTVETAVRNLNNIVDASWFKVKSCRTANDSQRAIGLGVQGFFDAMQKMSLQLKDARKFNVKLFEFIQYVGWETSIVLAKEYYQKYNTKMMNIPNDGFHHNRFIGLIPVVESLDWNYLEKEYAKYGAANTMITALMPTASTATFFNTSESTEPRSSNIYLRRNMAGEFVIMNPVLQQYLKDNNMNNTETMQKIIVDNGSVKNLNIPENDKILFRTAWELPQSFIVTLASDRGPFIDQSQSMNIYMEKPSINKVTSLLFASWKKYLKTGLYYLRTKPAAQPIKFTLENDVEENKDLVCSFDNDCISCTV